MFNKILNSGKVTVCGEDQIFADFLPTHTRFNMQQSISNGGKKQAEKKHVFSFFST